MKLHFAWLVALSCYTGTVHAQVKCKDEAKNDADWSVFYVIPGSVDPQAYGAFSTAVKWTDNLVELKEDTGPLGELLKAFYDAKDTYNIIAYNDFPPNFRQPSKCSSPVKGVLGYKDNDGWWLIHSVDKWPDLTENAFKPPPADAGLIVCITLPFDQMEKWATVVYYQDPVVYYFKSVANAATSLESKDRLKALTIPAESVYTPYAKMDVIENIGGAKVHLFGMLAQSNQDIYSTYMAPLLKQSLIAWTKPTKTEKLEASKCSTVYKLENVKPDSVITVKDKNVTREQDTARWVISKKKSAKAVVCIVGDIALLMEKAPSIAWSLEDEQLSQEWLAQEILSCLRYSPIGMVYYELPQTRA
ncbi:Deoxyribonuclease (DNase) II [Trichuris trichiura]|uniref:Deoxyribonuclease (DNase) II n=1 Tax=Trichuris trichiura TaxID=36087 RepID=A0A077YX86_TRITR|nr:Deoxyribonuclease (DNase) II [Trichuris trichiura]